MATCLEAYICTNKVTHARLLPTESAHRFTYPTISFLLPLSALENGELDLGGGWLFSYGGLWLRATGIRPAAYLRNRKQFDSRISIKQKLLEVLRSHSLDPNLFEDAWVLTMPSYFGFEGINPLTVYFCYKSDQSLWVVVLEVHNTFGERHVYVLPIGLEFQDAVTPSGYTFSWTFARQFHVSPFNDRSGFYTCSIVPPPHSPSGIGLKTSLPNVPNSLGPSIRIDLHASDPRARPLENVNEKGTPSRKLFAVLRPINRHPFTSKHLIHVLFKYPLSLFLSFPRIAYEAFRLHYFKGLDVLARPSPRAEDLSVEQSLPIPRNPVQQDQKDALLRGSGVGWQPEGILQRYSRLLVERFLHTRVRELDLQVELGFADPGFGTRRFQSSASASKTTLTIFIRSPQAFVYMFISPTAEIALTLGRCSESEFAVSDPDLFMRVFGMRPLTSDTLLARLAQRIRLLAVPNRILSTSAAVPQAHFLHHPHASNKITETRRQLTNILALLLFYSLLYVEKFIFTFLRARFVPGDEPWDLWNRAVVALK